MAIEFNVHVTVKTNLADFTKGLEPFAECLGKREINPLNTGDYMVNLWVAIFQIEDLADLIGFLSPYRYKMISVRGDLEHIPPEKSQ